MGQGIVLMFPSRTTLPWQGFLKGKPVRVTPEMVEAIPDKVPGIEVISPEFVGSRLISYGRKEFRNTVRGVNPGFERMRNTIAETGRFINPEDMAGRKRVCMIGDVLAQDLFGRQDVVGETIFIDKVPFTVVGVMRKKLQNSNYNGQRDERCAFIPWTTFAALYGDKYVSNFIFRPLDLGRTKAVTRGHQEPPGQADRLQSGRPGRRLRLGHHGFRETVHDLFHGLHRLPGGHRLVHPPRRRRGRRFDHARRRRGADARDRDQAGRGRPPPDDPMAVLQRVADDHAPRRAGRIRPLGRRALRRSRPFPRAASPISSGSRSSIRWSSSRRS